jgi:hypothetical protein
MDRDNHTTWRPCETASQTAHAEPSSSATAKARQTQSIASATPQSQQTQSTERVTRSQTQRDPDASRPPSRRGNMGSDNEKSIADFGVRKENKKAKRNDDGGRDDNNVGYNGGDENIVQNRLLPGHSLWREPGSSRSVAEDDGSKQRRISKPADPSFPDLHPTQGPSDRKGKGWAVGKPMAKSTPLSSHLTSTTSYSDALRGPIRPPRMTPGRPPPDVYIDDGGLGGKSMAEPSSRGRQTYQEVHAQSQAMRSGDLNSSSLQGAAQQPLDDNTKSPVHISTTFRANPHRSSGNPQSIVEISLGCCDAPTVVSGYLRVCWNCLEETFQSEGATYNKSPCCDAQLQSMKRTIKLCINCDTKDMMTVFEEMPGFMDAVQEALDSRDGSSPPPSWDMFAPQKGKGILIPVYKRTYAVLGVKNLNMLRMLCVNNQTGEKKILIFTDFVHAKIDWNNRNHINRINQWRTYLYSKGCLEAERSPWKPSASSNDLSVGFTCCDTPIPNFHSGYPECMQCGQMDDPVRINRLVKRQKAGNEAWYDHTDLVEASDFEDINTCHVCGRKFAKRRDLDKHNESASHARKLVEYMGTAFANLVNSARPASLEASFQARPRHTSEESSNTSEDLASSPEDPPKPWRQFCKCDSPDYVEKKIGQSVCLNCGVVLYEDVTFLKEGLAKKKAEAMKKAEASDDVVHPVEQESSRLYKPYIAQFPKFMKFPTEVRERVYHFVLRSDRPIAPHLCDDSHLEAAKNLHAYAPIFVPGQSAHTDSRQGDTYIRFHDDNEPEQYGSHSATYDRMSITRVSRAVRRESLPVFYSANTFAMCNDLSTYFERLSHLGQFHMVRNFAFYIDFSKELMAPKALRDVLQNIASQKTFEEMWTNRQHISLPNANASPWFRLPPALQRNMLATSKENWWRYTNSRSGLQEHPQYIAGGLTWMSTFLVLRKLASEFTSATDTSSQSEYSHKLVLHVPNAAIFTQYESLKYFPSICEGLGIKLHFVEGREVEFADRGIKLSWHQKYQKKDFQEGDVVLEKKEWDLEKITKRVMQMYPDMEDLRRPVRNSYMRQNCARTQIEWFSVDTAGGGRL